MKLHRSTVAAIGLVSLAAAVAPARASVITQTLSPETQIQGPPANTIIGDFFQSSLGTLTGVSLELEGTLTPKGDVLPSASPTLTTSFKEFPAALGPDSLTVTFPTEAATILHIVGEGPQVLEVGASFAVDITFDFSDLSRFISTNTAPQNLVDYGFTTTSNLGALGLDRTAFDGSAILTYTYSPADTTPDVPEPASFIVFCTGLFGLGFMRRRFA